MPCSRCHRLLAMTQSRALHLVPFSSRPVSAQLHSNHLPLPPSSYIHRRWLASTTASAAACSRQQVASTILSTVGHRPFSTVSSPSAPYEADTSSLSSLLSPTRRRLVQRIRSLLEELPAALRDVSLSADDRTLVRDTQQQLDQVFLLVVVGSVVRNTMHCTMWLCHSCCESDVRLLVSTVSDVVGSSEYNAGKSSFLNALLGGDFCKTGLLPTTDKITILRYAPNTSNTPSTASSPATPHIDDPNQPAVQSLYLPLPLLADLCIVDTPGTNAIVRSHEALTTHFVPRSDAILFVTSVERPFSESERAFMARIRQWGKKVVVVVNKWDLTETDDDRERIVRYVRENVEKELHESCGIFTVSARQASHARSKSSADELQASGIPRLERWLAEELSSGERVRLKLLSPVNVVGRILIVYEVQLREKESRSQADRRVMAEVDATIALFEHDVKQQADLEIAKLDSLLYDRMDRVERVVQSNAVLSNVWSLFRGAWASEWQQVFHGAEEEVRAVLSGLIDRVSECTKRAVTSINRTIQRHNQRQSNRLLTNKPTTAVSSPDSTSEAGTVAAEQSMVPLVDTATLSSSAPSHQQFVQLQQQVQRVLSPSSQQALNGQVRSTLTFAATLAASSAAAAVAVVALQLTNKLAFVPAALYWSPFVLSGVAALSALYAVPLYRQRVLRLQRAEMERWREQARRAMTGWLDSEAEERKRRLVSVRSDMERQVAGDERTVHELRRSFERLEREVVALREQIQIAQ